MRDELTKENVDSEFLISGEDIETFTDKNQQLDARRRLEEALEERRLSRELREFDFDFDDIED